MHPEVLLIDQSQPDVTEPTSEFPLEGSGLFSTDEFDLDSFFSESEEDTDPEHTAEIQLGAQTHSEQPNQVALLATLQNEARESIATITNQITAETFSAGISLTSSVFSTLSSLAGSCGVFCMHGLGAAVQAGSSGLSSTAGLSGIGIPNFSVDSSGTFHLDGSLDDLSAATGISQTDLLSGKFSSQEILLAYFASVGESFAMVFGFGAVGGLIEAIFDTFVPSNSAKAA